MEAWESQVGTVSDVWKLIKWVVHILVSLIFLWECGAGLNEKPTHIGRGLNLKTGIGAIVLLIFQIWEIFVYSEKLSPFQNMNLFFTTKYPCTTMPGEKTHCEHF